METELKEKLTKQKIKELIEIHRPVFLSFIKLRGLHTAKLMRSYDSIINKDESAKTVEYECNKEMRMLLRDLTTKN